MGLHVDVWSDFVCPWCYLASTSLKKLAESHDVTVAWKAYELRPKGSPPMPAAYKAKIQAMLPQLKAMAKSVYGVTINQGPFGIDSRPALIGHKVAEAAGAGAVYHQTVFEAYWLHGKNIEDAEVLGQLAEYSGLDAADFLAEIENPTHIAAVDADITQAQRYEIRGVPALVFEDRFYIPGAQPYDELVLIAEQISQRLELDA